MASMNPQDTHYVAILWSDLEHMLRAIGRDGGLVSPSIYDTAQCFRFNPPSNPWPIVDWLLAQQQADGGWLPPGQAKARYLPTLAAILALKSLLHIRRTTQDALDAGLMFLHQHQWADWADLDDLPFGADVILPRLLDDAKLAGLAVNPAPYQAVIDIGMQRRILRQYEARAHDLAIRHVWEGWGSEPLPALVDALGTVGHSPAASAFWLCQARSTPTLAALSAQVQRGLRHAEAATRNPVAGVVGTQWPMTIQERVYSLQALLLAGMLNPTMAYAVPSSVRVAIDQQLSLLQDTLMLTKTGSLEPARLDHPATAMAMTVLTTAGYPISKKVMTQFEQTAIRQMTAWRATPTRSLPGIAPMLHGLASLKLSAVIADYEAAVRSQQLPTGLWPSDPQQDSQVIATAQIISALLASGERARIPDLCQRLAMFQHRHGAWGRDQGSAEETASAVVALVAAKRQQCLPPDLNAVLVRAKRWLVLQYHPFTHIGVALWAGKERYRPLRIAHVVELTALIALFHEADLDDQ